jgi:DNA-binding MurR/RpiR family transcriptional regulator
VQTVVERIAEDGAGLTPAERRVGRAILDDPELVAFGTVADLAGRAGTSGATVVRFADRLGYQGFVGLQAAVRDEMALRLRPATERIRRPSPADVPERTLAVELDNVSATLASIDRAAFGRAVTLLADRRATVSVLTGHASRGVATTLAGELGMLRPGVQLVAGPPVAVAAALATIDQGAVVVAIDLPRYDAWLLDAVRRVGSAGGRIVAVTDSRLSPLAERAAAVLTVAADGAGPFDSHVGVLALANALVNGVAAKLRASATRRLDRVEDAWRDAGALVDG